MILADTQSKAPLSLLPIKVNRDFAHGPNHRALQSVSLYSILSLGPIGFHVSFLESVDLAAKYGFEGLDPDANFFAWFDNDALKRLLDDLPKRNLRLGAAG